MSKLTDTEQTFLRALYEKTGGNAAAQASMYEIGEAMGLDRSASSRTAEELMGWDMAEVRTLSGGIGITQEGLAEIHKMGGGQAATGSDGFTLPEAPVMDDDSVKALETEMLELKRRTPGLGLDFDVLSEIMTDMKCLEVQLTSPKPKTALIRECLRSTEGALKDAGEKDAAAKISALLGER